MDKTNDDGAFETIARFESCRDYQFELIGKIGIILQCECETLPIKLVAFYGA